jgi:preprotein translocase subunit Sss1
MPLWLTVSLVVAATVLVTGAVGYLINRLNRE